MDLLKTMSEGIAVDRGELAAKKGRGRKEDKGEPHWGGRLKVFLGGLYGPIGKRDERRSQRRKALFKGKFVVTIFSERRRNYGVILSKMGGAW